MSSVPVVALHSVDEQTDGERDEHRATPGQITNLRLKYRCATNEPESDCTVVFLKTLVDAKRKEQRLLTLAALNDRRDESFVLDAGVKRRRRAALRRLLCTGARRLAGTVSPQ